MRMDLIFLARAKRIRDWRARAPVTSRSTQREATFSGGIHQTSQQKDQATVAERHRSRMDRAIWGLKPVLDSLTILLARSIKVASALDKVQVVQIPIILLVALV